MPLSRRPERLGDLTQSLTKAYAETLTLTRYLTNFLIWTLTGDTRKIFVSNIKTVDESHSARVLIGCKPMITNLLLAEI